MNDVVRSLILLVLGIMVFSVGYYVILSGHLASKLGAFMGFFPIMAGVYLIYRWERLYKRYRHAQFLRQLEEFRRRNHMA